MRSICRAPESLGGLCCRNRADGNLVKLGDYPSSLSCRFEDFCNKASLCNG